jgi:hypothetical protein
MDGRKATSQESIAFSASLKESTEYLPHLKQKQICAGVIPAEFHQPNERAIAASNRRYSSQPVPFGLPTAVRTPLSSSRQAAFPQVNLSDGPRQSIE